jgi:predicted enzyme related to lactoylglutathione lyase
MTGPVGYYQVDDMAESLRQVLDAGARTRHDVKDLGGGRPAAVVEDADGNVFGLLQSP